MNTDSFEYELLKKIVDYYEGHRMPDYGDGSSELLMFLLWLLEKKEKANKEKMN